MSYETYSKFATAVKEEMPLLDYQQQLEILTIVVSAMKSQKENQPKTFEMTKEEKLSLFEKFKGSLNVPANFDPRKEYLNYLDERYNK